MSETSAVTGSDGYVSVEISDDKMEVRAAFFPSSGNGRNLAEVQAFSALNANNITHGILEENIHNAINKCNKDQKAVTDILVATGTKPLKASPEHINLKPEFFNRKKTVIKKDGSVDYKESSSFVMVKKGESVGEIFSYIPGKDGADVTGAVIPFKNKEMRIFKAGENLESNGNKIISTVHGRFLISGDLLSVTEVLEIGTDVDFHTGNISFAGDIIVDGVIHDGFRVAAGRNIRCKKIIKNAEVLCRGDLQVDLGLKGRGKALVRVNGNISCKFIEQGTVESRTGIMVGTSILSANINTLGKLTMGQKGTIITSIIVAEKGIEVFNLGRENCAPSTIWCGISFIENRKLDNQRTRHDVLKDKISKLKMKKNPPEKLLNQMKKALKIQEKEIEGLEKIIFTNEDASVKVHGTLFSGTEIHIGKYKTKIKKNETRVSVSLDKENLRIIVKPL